MKKLILSAVMMMAFVGNSFGMGEEVESSLKTTSNYCNFETAIADVMDPCLAAAATAYGILKTQMDDDCALDAALLVQEACEDARE